MKPMSAAAPVLTASPENFAMSTGPESWRIEPEPETIRLIVCATAAVCLRFSVQEAPMAARNGIFRFTSSYFGVKPIRHEPPSSLGVTSSATRLPSRSISKAIGLEPPVPNSFEASRTRRTTSK